MSTTLAANIDKGGLWEIGVMFPIRNPNMEIFEQYFTFYYDVSVGTRTFFIYDEKNRIKPNSFVFVGPSSDPTRDGDNNLLYFDNYDVFKISNIYSAGTNIWGVVVMEYAPDMPYTFQNNYLAGDNVTIRTLAESWEFLQSGDFTSISPLATPMTDNEFEYSRADPLDNSKGYSQLIRCDSYPSTDTDVGIVQEFRGRSRYLLNRMSGKTVRMSCWMKAGFVKSASPVLIEDDIDENIGANPQDDDIDENVDGNPKSNDIDENKIPGAGVSSGYMTPYLRTSFYSDTALSSLLDDYSESPGEIEKSTQAMLVEKIINISNRAMGGRISAYCLFETNSALEDMEFYVDDVLIEHCVGTSKENDGYYLMDINPAIGMSIQNVKSSTAEKGLLGSSKKASSVDPSSRIKISTTFKNRPGYFIEDMRVIESWNHQGYPVVLRAKMPGVLPNVLLCKMTVGDPKYIEGSTGTEKADVQIDFEEVVI